MASPGDVTWQHEQATKVGGVAWIKNSLTKGILKVNEDVGIEFDFKGQPSFKISPKEARNLLPRVVDMIPSLVLWDEDDHPSWAEVLQELKDKIIVALGSRPAEGAIAIDKKMLDGLLEVARHNHPNESFFLLKKDGRGVLAEAVLPQGTKGGRTMAIFSGDRLPYDKTILASFHSHPSGNGVPSEPDLRVFINYKVNIIAYFPYGDHDFKAYDNKGNRVDLPILE